MTDKQALIIGVVSDTHAPDRVAALHPDLLPSLKAAGVKTILHAGDICSPAVLESLNEVAPVIAVRGNRDWLFINKLPWRRDFTLGGVNFAMMHGIGNWGKYLEYKLKYANNGYRLENYLPMMLKAAPEAGVIVFGHTHFPEIIPVENQLVFNPGSASLGRRRGWKPTYGILRIQPEGKMEAEICELGL